MNWSLIDFLYPPRCPFCRTALPAEAICPDCQRDLPWLVGPAARRQVECVRLCVSALRYHGPVRDCVLRLKFRRRHGYARILGELAAQCARDHLSDVDIQVVTWPGVSRRELRRRGFDQSRLLAQAVAREWGLEETELLRKKNTARRQSTLQGDAARRANVLGAFSLLDPAAVAGKRVLLVDDVVTSGATMTECARMLLTAGAEGVWAVTLANAKGGGR